MKGSSNELCSFADVMLSCLQIRRRTPSQMLVLVLLLRSKLCSGTSRGQGNVMLASFHHCVKTLRDTFRA